MCEREISHFLHPSVMESNPVLKVNDLTKEDVAFRLAPCLAEVNSTLMSIDVHMSQMCGLGMHFQ